MTSISSTELVASGQVRSVEAEARNEEARRVWRQSAQDGSPLTGAALGERFGRSGRWGRERVAEARQGIAASAAAAQPERGSAAGGGSRGNGMAAAGGASVSAGDRGGQNGNPVSVGGGRAEGAGDTSGSRSVGLATGDGRNGSGPVVAAGRRGGGLAGVPLGGSPGSDVVPWWASVLTWLGIVVVIAAAGWGSTDHLAHLARMAGEHGVEAWRLPASVDGLAVVAALAVWVADRRRQQASAAWAALLAAVGVSIAGNVIAVHGGLIDDGTLRVVVGAVPPLSLAVTIHLGLQTIRTEA